jgi:hypothetical protein
MGSCLSREFKPNDVQIRKFVAIIQARTIEFSNVSPKIIKYFKDIDRYRLINIIKQHSNINEKDAFAYLYSLEYDEDSNIFRVNQEKLDIANSYSANTIHSAWIIEGTFKQKENRKIVPSYPVPIYQIHQSIPNYETNPYNYPGLPLVRNEVNSSQNIGSLHYG